MKHHRFILLGCIAAGAVTLGSLPAEQRTFHQVVVWESGSLTGRGLFLSEEGAAGEVWRLLVETPAGNRAVLTHTLDVVRGREEVELELASGWTFTTSKGTRFQAGSLREYRALQEIAVASDESREVQVRLHTSGGLRHDATSLLAGWPHLEHEALMQGIRADGFLEVLASEAPPEAVEVTAFLFVARDRRAEILSYLEPPVHFLWMTLPRSQRAIYLDRKWSQRLENRRPGLLVTDPSLLEFASRFPRLDSRQPLADHRLGAVLPLREEPVTH
jgi:hypothetical protein